MRHTYETYEHQHAHEPHTDDRVTVSPESLSRATLPPSRTNERTHGRTKAGLWRVRCARLVDRPEEALEVGAQVARELARDDELAQPAPGVITRERGPPEAGTRTPCARYGTREAGTRTQYVQHVGPWGQAALRLRYVPYRTRQAGTRSRCVPYGGAGGDHQRTLRGPRGYVSAWARAARPARGCALPSGARGCAPGRG